MKNKFSVSGMTCSNCSLAVEKAIKKLNGVKSVTVSLIEKLAIVEYDENTVSIPDIISAVKQKGYGCNLSEKTEKNKKGNSQAKSLLIRFVVSLTLLFALLYFSMGKMLGLPLPSLTINLIIQALLSLAIILVNYTIYLKGIKSFFVGGLGMDALITLGSLSGYIYSVVVSIIYLCNGTSPSGIFFEASAMVLTLINLGKFLEELSKEKTGKEVDKLVNLIPEEVNDLVNGKEEKVKSSLVKVGDKIVLRAGDYIFSDGVIIEGVVSLDKSVVTGESMLVENTVGDSVVSGSMVKNGYAIMVAKKVGEETLFAKIVERVKSAGASKSPMQKLADKISAVFVPIVSVISLITLIVWLLINGNTYNAFNFAVSVLVISCPCALGLATPVAIMAGIGKGASLKVLFKDAESLQKLESVNAVLLDKTATLTEGKMQVESFINLTKIDNEKLLKIALSLEDKSAHPLAESIKNFVHLKKEKVTNFEYKIGVGLSGKIGGENYYLGSEKIAPKGAVFESVKMVAKTTLYLFNDNKLLGYFIISDKLKDGSLQAVKTLKEMGVETALITGDEEKSATYFASLLGIDSVEYNVLPEDKYQKVVDYQQKGKIVAMVGDGINDSPALKQADVGVAIGTGTDVAIESASVVLMNGKITSLVNGINLSKKTNKVIKGNLFWAFIYNALAIPIACGVLMPIGIVLTPAISSACMCLSSLFVVTNALRLNKFKEEKSKENLGMNLIVEGMMCMHCEKRVKDGVLEINGVKSVEINLKKKLVKIDAPIDLKNEIIEKITALGYQVKGEK